MANLYFDLYVLHVRRSVVFGLEIGNQRVEGCEQRDQEAQPAFAPAAAADIAAEETRKDAPDIVEPAADIAGIAQILGSGAGISVEAADHVRDVAVDIMLQPVRQGRSLAPGQGQGRMDSLIAPDLDALAEQAGIGRLAERSAPAMPHQARADPVIDRDVVIGEAGLLRHAAQFLGQFGRHMLVGIDLDDPVAAAGVDAGIAARTFQFPGAFDQAVGELAGDGLAGVGAFVEHDDDLVGEAQSFEAGGQAAFLIMGDHEGGESHLRASIQRTAPARSSTMASGSQSFAFSASLPQPVRTRIVAAPIACPRPMSAALSPIMIAWPGSKPNRSIACFARPGSGLRQSQSSSGLCGQMKKPSTDAPSAASSSRRRSCTRSTASSPK